MLGNEAVARGAWEARVAFGSGYPGTPSTEILEALAVYPDVKVQWAPNEKVGYEVCMGASLAGVRALVTMKHVGLNVAADPFFSSSYMGVNGGLVVVSADDPGMASSQDEQDNRSMARAAKVLMVEPYDAEEARWMTREAFALSERVRLPGAHAHDHPRLPPDGRGPPRGARRVHPQGLRQGHPQVRPPARATPAPAA